MQIKPVKAGDIFELDIIVPFHAVFILAAVVEVFFKWTVPSHGFPVLCPLYGFPVLCP